jgi:hypothetical protein
MGMMGLSGGERQAIAPLKTPCFPGFVPKIRPKKFVQDGFLKRGLGIPLLSGLVSCDLG